ncbi:MAG: T9SS type A sorting domain-containing protein [Bacteroidia bacterium]
MKTNKKLSSINYATSTKANEFAFLKWSGKLIICCMLLIGFTKCYAQNPIYPIPPALEWQKSYWPTTRPVMGSSTFVNQTRAESGEDWFYSVAKSKENGVQNGYIGSGYNSYPNWKVIETTGCLDYEFTNECDEFEETNHNKGMTIGQISFIDIDGNKLWHKNLKQGELTNVIQTNDGNYLAVGTTMATEGVGYNPSTGNINGNFFKKRDEINNIDHECGSSYRNQRKAYLVKVKPNGEIIWQFIYGLQNFIAGDPVAYNQNTLGLDVVEQGDFYYLTGFAVNPAQSNRQNNYIIKVDKDGYVQNKRFIGNLSLWGKGGTIAGFKDPNTNVISLAVGTETIDIINPNNPALNIYDAKVIVLDDNLNELNVNSNVYWSLNPTASSSKSTRVWDLTFNSAGDLLLPVATNCVGCDIDFHGKADNLLVYKLNITTGGLTLIRDLGPVLAYDLRMGITNTADGGCAVISVKEDLVNNYKPNNSNDGNNCVYFDQNNNINHNQYWRTNSYVAKFAANGDFEWEKQWDANTPRQSGALNTWNYPDLNFDVKTQECMYAIVQNDDGSYTVAGNNGTNFDDEYLVKINGDCDLRLDDNTFDVKNNSNSSSIYPNYTLTTNETWNTSKKVKASVVIPSGLTLTINGTRTATSTGFNYSTKIEFADSRKTNVRTNIIVQQGGQLIINGAMLTSLASCAGTNSKWDGILVEGSPSSDQMTRANQGYVQLNDAIIENSLNAISTSSYYFSPNLGADIIWPLTGGGIIVAENTTFRNNKRHIELMAYKNNVIASGKTKEFDNKSSFSNCTFELAGSNYVTTQTNPAKRTMVTAWGVKGVRFTACDFKNTAGSINAEKENYDRGTGIYALDASLMVYGSVTNCTLNKLGTFDDLSTGIQNVWSAGLPQMSVYSHLKFTKNDKSIVLASGNTATIHNNKFDLNIPTDYYNKAYSTNGNQLKTGIVGILANEMGGYLIERNEFKDDSKSTKIIIGSVLNNSDVFGTGAKVRINWYTDNAIGLQTQFNNKDIDITCNRFTDLNSSAFLMNPNSNTSTSKTPKFGDCGFVNERKDYKNEFITNPLNDMNNYLAAPKTYVYEPTAVNIPVNVINVNVTDCSASGLSVSSKDNCATTPSIDCDNRMIANPNNGKSKYNESKTQITSLTNAINSGNLTSTGLQEAITEREYYYTELAQGRGEVLWAYNTWEGMDSTVNANDSIIAFLVGESDLASKKLLVATYYNAGKLSDANNLLGEIESDGSDELANFIAYYNLLITANLDSRNIFQLTDEEWITLETIAATRSSAAESAKGIFTLVKDYSFDAYIEKGINGEESALMAKNTSVASNVIAKQTNQLNVYPNPANNLINIGYIIEELTENTTITLLDITGKQVVYQLINKKNGTIQLDALSLNSGFYFVRLSNGKTINTTSKIIITH